MNRFFQRPFEEKEQRRAKVREWLATNREWMKTNSQIKSFDGNKSVPSDAVMHIGYMYNGSRYSISYDSGKPIFFPPYKKEHVVDSFVPEYDSIKIVHQDGSEEELEEEQLDKVKMLSGPLGNFYVDVEEKIDSSIVPARRKLIENIFSRETDKLVMENFITDDRVEL